MSLLRSGFCGGRLLMLLVISAGLISVQPVLVGQEQEVASVQATDQLPEVVANWLERLNMRRGICVVLGKDGTIATQLATQTEFLVQVRDPQAEAIRQLLNESSEAGLGIDRLSGSHGSLQRLPYADRMIDLIIATSLSAKDLETLATAEILRVLRPGGVVLAGRRSGLAKNALSKKSLGDWARTAKVAGRIWEDDEGSWVYLQKPQDKAAGEWTHWEHGPDNNPVSEDTRIKAPYMTQFLGGPMYIGMPSITTAAGGRTFLAVGHIAHHPREWGTLQRLIARNGYNGTILWERKLPDDYLVHRSAFIATSKTFYMIDGNRCLLLDPETGREKGQLRFSGVAGDLKWIAIKDGVLYALVGDREEGTKVTRGDRTFGGWSWSDLSPGYYGKQIPFGYGHTVTALNLKDRKTLWSHKEKGKIDSRAMAMQGGKMFLMAPSDHLRCLSAKDGAVLWTNESPGVRTLIEEPGKKLTSTPGFKTMCLTVATPDALIIQGQTRMNVVSVSTRNGEVLWNKRKITNNPNAIYMDGKLVLGVGTGGNHIVVDPVSGEVEEDLKFRKRACTRLTATGDSIFCRGEGTLRFDRATKKVFVDGGVRPACNDGALPAHGLLYIGPWQCDCNLSLIGAMGKCSAGTFRFDILATEAERLDVRVADLMKVAPLSIQAADWSTYRGDNHRSAGSPVKVAQNLGARWSFAPPRANVPVAPTTAGGLVFLAGEDGKVRAIKSSSGELHWEFSTSAPIKNPPSIWEGRAYVGSGDGYVYCLEAATGRLLWRFRAAPVERQIMVYGRLSSTWPVNTGVMVHEGAAYFAAGIIDHDGTYVYALDAKTGKIKWQNNSSGHLSGELRKGISAQGNLSVLGDQLLLAGGNQVSPAIYDIKTGECRSKPFAQGQPKANGGQFVGVYNNVSVIAGGRILYSDPRNVATKGKFTIFAEKKALQMNYGGIPPAWTDQTLAMVNFKHGKLICCNGPAVTKQLASGYGEAATKPAMRRFLTISKVLEVAGLTRWQSNMNGAEKFETVSIAVAENAVVAVVRMQQKVRAHPQWYVVVLDAATSKTLYQQELPEAPLPGGLSIDREGQVLVAGLSGKLLCLGAVPAGSGPANDRPSDRPRDAKPTDKPKDAKPTDAKPK